MRALLSFILAYSCVCLAQEECRVWNENTIEAEQGELAKIEIEAENFWDKPFEIEFADDFVGKNLSLDEKKGLITLLKQKVGARGYLSPEMLVCSDEQSGKRFIRVRLGKRISIEKIEIVGLTHFKSQEILSLLSTKEPSLLRDLFGILGFGNPDVQKDIAHIEKFFRSQGYLDAKVVNTFFKTLDDLKSGILVFEINEGKQFSVGHLEPSRISSNSGLVIGEPVNLVKIDAEIDEMVRETQDQGFAFSKSNRELSLDGNKVNLNVHIDPGERIRIRSIQVLGTGFSDENAVLGWFSHLVGRDYSFTETEAARLEFIHRSGFGGARIRVNDNGDKSCDLFIYVTEKFPWMFKLSPSYYSGEGLLFSSYILNQNIFGKGIYGYGAVQLSSVRELFELLFYDPRTLGSSTSILMELHNRYYDYHSFNAKTLGAGLRATFRLHDRVSVSGSVLFNNVRSHAAFERSAFQDLLSIPDKNNLARVGLSMRVFPVERGRDWNKYLYFDIGASLSSAVTLSDSDFIEPFAQLNMGTVLPPFYLRAELNVSTIRPLSGQAVPISERYFLGGRNNIRGYQIFSVSPYLQTSAGHHVAIGGDTQFSSTLEAEYLIWDFLDLKGYVFSDLGNAFASTPSISEGPLVASVGFGFNATIWEFPLKLEIAFPVVQTKGALPFDFYLGFSSITF